MDVLVRMGQASCREVLESLPDPPSYSSVRALITIMVTKGYLEHFQEGKKYIYRPIAMKEKEKKSMLKKVVNNFYAGSAPKAISTILNFSSSGLSPEDFEELRKLIEEAEKQSND